MAIEMEELRIAVVQLPGHEDIPLPRYMTQKAAGLDIHAAVNGELSIAAGERAMVPTGLSISLPEGYEAEIRPRSGLAIHHGVTLINSPGTIDADYRGEIRILMINHGKETFVVRRGDRIAQMIVHRVCRVSWQTETDLDGTTRGVGGFGHTG